ncbi:MAG TPA: hypothetical protein VKS82_18415, partial [Streptosporangiaceae bacterium]|nr:hypothetical protein [Streptosporangiaceae bacterium]
MADETRIDTLAWRTKPGSTPSDGGRNPDRPPGDTRLDLVPAVPMLEGALRDQFGDPGRSIPLMINTGSGEDGAAGSGEDGAVGPGEDGAVGPGEGGAVGPGEGGAV